MLQRSEINDLVSFYVPHIFTTHHSGRANNHIKLHLFLKAKYTRSQIKGTLWILLLLRLKNFI